MRIVKKHQVGGVIYTPFFEDEILAAQVSEKTSQTKQSKEKDNIEKEILSVIRENGIPSDVDAFATVANKFLSKPSFTSTSTEHTVGQLMKLHSMANKIRFNNKLHEIAVSQIVKEGAGSELALTNEGGIYALDTENDNELKVISASNYHENNDRYQLLTNSELLQYRETNPAMAWNSSVLTDLRGVVGMKSITDYVKNTIRSFGKTSTREQFDRYTVKNKGKIEEGFEQLLGMSPDGVYNLTTILEETHQGYKDENSLMQALHYLYKSLPNNMRHVLRATAAAEGLDPNKTNNVYQLLAMAVVEHTDHTSKQNTDVKYDSSATKQSMGEGKTGKLVEMSGMESIAMGSGTTPVLTTIASSNSRGGIQTFAQPYPLQDKEGNNIGRGDLMSVLDKAAIGSIVDKNSMYFGDHRISDTDITRVVYDGTSTLQRAYLPIDMNIYANTGLIKPDLNAQKRYEDFVNWLDQGYGLTKGSIEAKLHQLQLDLEFDQTAKVWKFKEGTYKPFLILNGYASTKAIDFDPDSDWVHQVDSDLGKQFFDTYKRYVNYGTGKATKGNIRDDFDGGWFGIGDASSMYKSAIFMPMLDAKMATIASSHERTYETNYIDILNQDRLRKEQRSIKTNFN